MKIPSKILIKDEEYRFKLKFSALCDLAESGIDLITGEGWQVVNSTTGHRKLIDIFQKGLEGGGNREVPYAEAQNLLDDYLYENGFDDLFSLIAKEIGMEEAIEVVEDGESNLTLVQDDEGEEEKK